MADFNALIEGYRRFRDAGLGRASASAGPSLAEGQSPKVMVIACSDSRVDPAPDFRRAAGRDVRRPQRRQPRPALRARQPLSRRLGGARIRRHPARGRRAGGDGPRLLRRLRGGADRPVRRRRPWRGPFHRPLDRHAGRARATAIRARHPELGRRPSSRWSWRACASRCATCAASPGSREREAAGRLKLHGAYFAIADGVLHVLRRSERRRSAPA